MSKVAWLLAFLVVLACCGQAAARDAVLDMEAVIWASEPGQKASEQLKVLFGEKKAALDWQKDKVDQLFARIKSQAMFLGDEAKKKLETEAREEARAFNEASLKYEQDLVPVRERLVRPIMEAAVEAVTAYAKKSGIEKVYDLNGTPFFVYVDQALNITDAVVQELNRRWKEKPQAPEKAAAKPAAKAPEKTAGK
jgi:Skp family chaperone for outer membrane proteins